MKLILTITFLLSYLAISKGEAHYFIGTQGLSCNQVCYNELKNCNPKIETNDNTLLFAQLGVKCTPDTVPWISQDQPCYVSDPTDPSYGKCLGFVGVPDAGQCSGSHPAVQRLCRCDDPEDSASTFGLGYSSGMITPEENWIFQHYVTPGNVGVMTHFWITYLSKVDNGTIVRYYIDGEHEASIQFTPSLACGVGFYDDYAPWGNDWFGKGAKDGGWFNKFRIPFHKSIVVTVQHLYGSYDGFYMILRGSLNAPIYIDGKPLPATAKMNQVRIEKTFQVADWIPLINESKGPGAVFMVTLAAESENLNFLEGCIHAYFDGKNEFPGVVLATGTEDYFDSAWYYNAGRYYQPTSGLTHFIEKPGSVTWSSYRFHDKDPLYWKDGFQLIWRNGDLDDKTGMKCHTISKGKVHDHPTASKVYAYAWYYTWNEEKTAEESLIKKESKK